MKKATVWLGADVPQYSCSSLLTRINGFAGLMEKLEKKASSRGADGLPPALHVDADGARTFFGLEVVRQSLPLTTELMDDEEWRAFDSDDGIDDEADDAAVDAYFAAKGRTAEYVHFHFPDGRYLTGRLKGDELVVSFADDDRVTSEKLYDLLEVLGLDPTAVVFDADAGGGGGHDEWYYEVAGRRSLAVVHVKLTEKCNSIGLCRKYCYATAGDTELSPGKLLNVFKYKLMNCRPRSLQVTLGGGEPTLYPRLPEALFVLKACWTVGAVNMTTNGVALHPEWDKIDYLVDGVAVSVDSLRYPDAFSGKDADDGVPDSVVENVSVYRRKRFSSNVFGFIGEYNSRRTALNVVLSPDNVSDVTGAVEFCKRHGVGAVNFLTLKSGGESSFSPAGLEKLLASVAKAEKKAKASDPKVDVYVDECARCGVEKTACRLRVAVVGVDGEIKAGCPFGCDPGTCVGEDG